MQMGRGGRKSASHFLHLEPMSLSSFRNCSTARREFQLKVPQVEPWLTEAEVKAVADVVRSGWITQGSKTKEFCRRGRLALLP